MSNLHSKSNPLTTKEMGTTAKTQVHNVIILDRSGSMNSIKTAAMKGCNEVISSVREAKKEYSETMDQKISLILFDSQSIDTLAWDSDPEKTPLLTPATYIPGACTPLYDAIGITLSRLEKQIETDGMDHSVIVTIITDGYENASIEYTGAMVKQLIDRLTEKGWSFAYMGADHDVEAVSASISITNTFTFDKSTVGAQAMFEKDMDAKRRYWEKLDRENRMYPHMSREERREKYKVFSKEYFDDKL